MNKDFVPYAPSLALEELGFNESCLATIDQTEYVHIKGTKEPIRGSMMYFPVECPLYQQAFRWFREKHKLHAWTSSRTDINGNTIYIAHGRTIPDTTKDNMIVDIITYNVFSTVEEAELDCLIKLIEIVKTK